MNFALEAVRGLKACWRLVCMDEDGLDDLDLSSDGFWNSFAAIFLVELKNWKRTFVTRVDHTQVHLRNKRVEYNPVSKLMMVRNDLNQALAMHYKAAPGLEKIAVIPLLVHWGMEATEAHPLLQSGPEVCVVGKTEAYNTDLLCDALIQQATAFYSFVDESPPVISVSMKRALLSCIDLSVRAHPPSGNVADKLRSSTQPEGAKRRYDHTISPALDALQSATIYNRSPGHTLLSGVPGTGKTIMLLGRVRWFSKHFPNQRQLFIVHQKVLINHLRQKYQHQFLSGKQVRGVHFMRFVDWFSRTFDVPPAALRTAAQEQADRLDELVDAALEWKLPLKERSKRFYICDRDIFGPADIVQP